MSFRHPLTACKTNICGHLEWNCIIHRRKNNNMFWTFNLLATTAHKDHHSHITFSFSNCLHSIDTSKTMPSVNNSSSLHVTILFNVIGRLSLALTDISRQMYASFMYYNTICEFHSLMIILRPSSPITQTLWRWFAIRSILQFPSAQVTNSTFYIHLHPFQDP